MPTSSTRAALNIGFLTVIQDASGYLGGYLVTNAWGRPLEFRLTTAVQPNRVQQLLYGDTLSPYLCSELIGKTLVDKSAATVQVILTDCEAVLELRRSVETPVAWIHGHSNSDDPIYVHPEFGDDASTVRDWLARVDESLELTEPFSRIREAIGEARKMGATARG